MLITDKNILRNYGIEQHLWVGIPSIEVTPGGRTFLTFYSGGTKEEIGNYCMLICSEDGKQFSDPIAVCYADGYRCYDPCLWIDPLGRLWFTWSRCPEDGLFAAICDNPDAEEIVFGEEFFVGNDIMMNKPIVLSTGEWVFPIAVWAEGVRALPSKFDSQSMPKGSFAYVTYDHGKTFQRRGFADVKNRSFDEHMFLELTDGTLRCFVRTNYGIGATDSFDGGLHWSCDFDTGYKGPCSRFHIRRLPSGRVLLINHVDYNGRNNLTAMLSEDDGQTFPYRLLLDERSFVAYPDAALDRDGNIHITYDHERGALCTRFDDIMKSAREILTAVISEEDIIAGRLVKETSYLKHVAYKLTSYAGELTNPFNECSRFSDAEYAGFLNSIGNDTDEVLAKVFEEYHIHCVNIHHIEAEKLDRLIDDYKNKKAVETLSGIIHLVRNVAAIDENNERDTINAICRYLVDNLESNISLEHLAKEFHFSTHYISHIFKKATGMSVGEFKMAQRIRKAKLLLRTSEFKITEIATACGFENPSYFSEAFAKEVGVSPSRYRNLTN